MTPFSDKFWITFIVSTLIYAIEFVYISKYGTKQEDYLQMSLLHVTTAAGVMFYLTYFIRRVLT